MSASAPPVRPSLPQRHPLARWVAEACADKNFAALWAMDESAGYVLCGLSLAAADRLDEPARRALYRDLVEAAPLPLLSRLSARVLPPSTIAILAKAEIAGFQPADWVALIALLGDSALGAALAPLDRVTATLIRQFGAVPPALLRPRLLSLLNRLKISRGRWRALGSALAAVPVATRKSCLEALVNVRSPGDFFSAIMLLSLIDEDDEPFFTSPPLRHKLLRPITTSDELRAEARFMRNKLEAMLPVARSGQICWFHWLGAERASVQFGLKDNIWRLETILGTEHQAVTPASEAAIRAAARTAIAAAAPPPNLARAIADVPEVRRILAEPGWRERLAEVAGALAAIRGRSRAVNRGAFFILELSDDRYVEILSVYRTDDFILEAVSHRYSQAVDESLTERVVDFLARADLAWPRGKANFMRLVHVADNRELLDLAALALALLAALFGYRPRQALAVKVHLP